MDVRIIRAFQNDKQTLGQLLILDSDRVAFSCNTLELPYVDNKRNISCIPTGEYWVRKRKSPKFGLCFIVEDVPNRKYILIHKGNFHTDIRGCILVGSAFKDINNDGYTDVINSGDTVNKMLNILPDRFKMIIE
jgi:hypothetical protein